MTITSLCGERQSIFGTTTVTLWLVDLITGKGHAQVAEYNGQIACGEDVISRIIYSSKNGGSENLRSLVIESINSLVDLLWSAPLPWTGSAPPATYRVNGRQYGVIAASGGNKIGTPYGDAYIAFALPQVKD